MDMQTDVMGDEHFYIDFFEGPNGDYPYNFLDARKVAILDATHMTPEEIAPILDINTRILNRRWTYRKVFNPSQLPGKNLGPWPNSDSPNGDLS